VNAGLGTLLAVLVVAAAAPVLVAILPGRLPQVVLLLAGGVLVGPHALNLADPDSIGLLTDLGLGFLFLLAGYELDLRLFRQQPGRLAVLGWLGAVVLGGAAAGGLELLGSVHAVVPVTLALTTTTLGTLLPVLRDHGLLAGSFGRYVLAAGAVGELFPILAMAVFFGAHGELSGLLSLVGVAVVAAVLGLAPRLVRHNRLGRILMEGEHATSQTTLRLTGVLLVLLLVAANSFGLDTVLGAFLAGIVLRRWAPGDVRSLEQKLDALGYGFFIPIFFVSAVMKLQIGALADNWGLVLLLLGLLLAARGLPSLLVYRHALPWLERVQMAFWVSTTLPLLVALSEVGVRNGTLPANDAAALVGAGALSVLVFPAVAVALRGAGRPRGGGAAGPGSRTRRAVVPGGTDAGTPVAGGPGH
jgi:Kef-type K+ transport system membrane component KefB